MTRDNRIRFAFLSFVACSRLSLLADCNLEPDTSEVSQDLGACPWAPPQPCWPALWGENGRCNNLCLDVGGDFAVCPEIQPTEENTCCGGNTPITACGACLERIKHTCTGGFEP